MERQALQAEPKRTEKVTSVHWLTACGLCASPLGWTQGWVTGRDGILGHGTQTYQFLGILLLLWAPGLGVVGGGSPRAYDAQQAGSMSCSCEQRPVVGYSSR